MLSIIDMEIWQKAARERVLVQKGLQDGLNETDDELTHY